MVILPTVMHERQYRDEISTHKCPDCTCQSTNRTKDKALSSEWEHISFYRLYVIL